MLEALLAAMLVLAPHEDPARLRAMADAIAASGGTRDEMAVLVTIAYYETRFGHAGVPFGLVSFRQRIAGQPVEVCARTALEVYRRTAMCGRRVETRLGWYHTGRCAPDRFSRREAATVRRVLARLPAREAR